MAKKIENLPLIVITGPTASGKTSLAIELAKNYGGEIICADSRSVYKGMDIGTAKPTKEEQSAVVHWGLDLVNPGDYYSAADFKSYADAKIKDIRQRGNIPFLVGGTGLYIDAVLFDYQFGSVVDENVRQQLEKMTIEELHIYCDKNNIQLPENKLNKRYVVRNIERNGLSQQRREFPLNNTIVVGISTEKSILRTRIESRIEQLFNDGVIDEARQVGEQYGWEVEALTGNVYRLAGHYLAGLISFDEMKTKLVTADWRLAKRQLTWMKRNKFINWFSMEDARIYLSNQLAMYK